MIFTFEEDMTGLKSVITFKEDAINIIDKFDTYYL